MLKFKQSLVALFVVLALIGLVTTLAPSSTRGQANKPSTDVTVVNTPDVNVANIVRVSEPHREPVNVTGTFEGGDGSAAGVLFTVPPGKQLVVTYASAFTSVAAGNQVVTVIRGVNSGGTSFFHYLKLAAVPDPSSSISMASEPLQFRLDAGARVEVIMNTIGFGSGSAGLVASISGYLVDVPQQ